MIRKTTLTKKATKRSLKVNPMGTRNGGINWNNLDIEVKIQEGRKLLFEQVGQAIEHTS